MTRIHQAARNWLVHVALRVQGVLRRTFYEVRICFRARLGLAGTDHADGVIVSVTTYPARLKSFRMPLLSLLHQTIQPEKLVIVLADEEFHERQLPAWLAKLIRDHNIELLWTASNMRSYKKLIPLLITYPRHAIVTADDDLLYPPRWLEGLVDASRQSPGTVVGYRSIPVLCNPDGSVRPYMDWLSAVGHAHVGPILLTTGGGILFPPGSLPPETIDIDVAQTLCPTADDVWFWGMTLLAGTKTESIPPGFVQHPQARDSETSGSLFAVNGPGGANDRQIEAILAHFNLWDKLRATAE